jgi:hypothetical protein
MYEPRLTIYCFECTTRLTYTALQSIRPTFTVYHAWKPANFNFGTNAVTHIIFFSKKEKK